MQVVAVATLVPQPRSKAPAHGQEQEQADSEGNEDEPSGQVELQGEDHDRHGTEDRRRRGDDPLELLGTDAEDARVVRTAQDEDEHPGGDDDDDQRHVRQVVDLHGVGNRPPKDEAGDAGQGDGEDVEQDGAGGVDPQRVPAQVRTIAMGVGLSPADAGGSAQRDRVMLGHMVGRRLGGR